MKLAEEEMPISNLRNELNIAKSVLELEGQKSEQLLRNWMDDDRLSLNRD